MVKKCRCIIINTYFENEDLTDSSIIKENNQYIKETRDLIKTHSQDLELGRYLFVFGAPKYLPFFCVFLDKLKDSNGNQYLCKYDISVEDKTSEIYNVTKSSNRLIAMYLKTKSIEHPTKSYLETKTNRVLRTICKYCNKIISDWGGKKHLMNPLGSAISDVWSDLGVDSKNVGKISPSIIERIAKLNNLKLSEIKIIKQSKIRRDM